MNERVGGGVRVRVGVGVARGGGRESDSRDAPRREVDSAGAGMQTKSFLGGEKRRGGAKVVESRMRTARIDAQAKAGADVGDVARSAD